MTEVKGATVNCPICGELSTRVIIENLYDDRYGYPGSFQLMECDHCTHKYLRAGFSSLQITELYSQYYPRSSFSLMDHIPRVEKRGFDAWLEGVRSAAFTWVPRDVRVLDIGCGFGETLGYHKARGCDAHGIDADENIRRVADQFGYDAKVGLFDANLYQRDFFDWITLDQVLEHMQEPTTVLRGVASILKSDGRVAIAVPNADGWGAKLFGKKWINWHAPYHLNFFSKESMLVAATQCGLVLEKTTTVTPSAWLSFQWMHTITAPAEGTPSQYWTHQEGFSRAQRRGFWLASFMDRLKLNHLLTRFFDVLGFGDSRIYVLRKA